MPDTSPFMLEMSNLINSRIESAIFRAVVTAITADSVRIKRTGQTAEDQQNYAAVDIYPFPQVDDEVLVLKVGMGYTVVGRIVRTGLDVLHTTLGDLEITGTLTLGAGGAIVDADGSRWDQDGITLQATSIIADSISVQRTGFNGRSRWSTAIDTNFIRSNWLNTWTDGGINARDAGLTAEATDADGTTHSSLRVVSTGGLTTDVDVQADGQILLGVNYASGHPNIAIFAAGSYGSGTGVIFIANRSVAPSSNPTGGGILYSSAGAGTWRGSSGTVTTFGPAEPHCPDCGRDFAWEWQNERYGHLAICAWCATENWTRGIIRREQPAA